MSLPKDVMLTDQDELLTAKKIHSLILQNDNNPELLEFVIEHLTNESPEFIYRISSYHVDLQNFLRQLIYPQVIWVKKYLQKHYVAMAILTLDQHYLTIYDVLMGATLYSNFLNKSATNNSRSTLLNIACEWRSYPALLFALQSKQKVIENFSFENDMGDLQKHIQDILKYTSFLAHTYWQLGFMQAGIVLNRVANNLSKKIINERNYNSSENEQIFSYAENLMENSIKYFLCAFELENNSFSRSILNNMTHHRNLNEILGTAFFSDKHKALEQVSQWIDTDKFNQLQENAHILISNALNALEEKSPLTAVVRSRQTASSALLFDPYQAISLLNKNIRDGL